MSSRNSLDSGQYNSSKNKENDILRTKSRISFFQNEKLAEKISRDQSMKRVKKETDHMGLLSEINKKKKLIPRTGQRSKKTGELINQRLY